MASSEKLLGRTDSEDVTNDLANEEQVLYQYKLLTRFTRVLKLLPDANLHGDLRCELSPVGQNEQFEPVSYAWGPVQLDRILYHGSDGSQVIPITANVDQMLRHLRFPDKPRKLWVDAICINQSDDDEKGHQVERMTRIYKNRSVIVWLGSDDGPGQTALRFLQSLKDNGVKRISAQHILSPHGAYSKLDHRRVQFMLEQLHVTSGKEGRKAKEDYRRMKRESGNDSTSSRASVETVLLLYDRPWFRRRWILQEVASAASGMVVCGPMALGFHEFLLASWTLVLRFRREFRLEACTVEIIETIFQLNHLFLAAKHRASEDPMVTLSGSLHQQRDILWLLSCFWNSLCSDPRDRIYALLGLADNVDRHAGESDAQTDLLPVPIRYNRPVGDVYKDFAIAYISRFSHQCTAYGLLQCAGAFHGSGQDAWPSWVPDWSVPRRFRPFLGLGASDTDDDNDEFQEVNIRVESSQGALLVVLGMVYDEVQAKVEWPSETSADVAGTAFDFLLRCMDLMRRANYLRWANAKSAELVAALFRLLTMRSAVDVHLRAKVVRIWDEMDNDYSLTLRAFQKDPDTPRKQAGTLIAVYEVCCGRSFTVTERGHIGLTPLDSRSRDPIVVFKNARTPFVLRKTDAGQKGYRAPIYSLVGDCWIDELMDGQAFDHLGDSWDEVRIG